MQLSFKETRHEAVRLLKTGVTIVVFPAGSVATASKGFGRAIALPWKMFPAHLVHTARASVIQVHLGEQIGRLFHLASRVLMTLRISLLIREFRRRSGTAIVASLGRVLSADELAEGVVRKLLLDKLYTVVFALGVLQDRSENGSTDISSAALRHRNSGPQAR